MKTIPVNNLLILVDDDIFDRLRTDCIVPILLNRKYPYYYTDGEHRPLGEYIIGYIGGLVVDHKDRQPLNCQRANLRHLTDAQNSQNRRSKRPNKHGFIGVVASHNRYRAQLVVNGVRHVSPSRSTPVLAALEYDLLVEKTGSLAHTNKSLNLL